ncbi:MAG: hydantoinase/oxoprolinase family protein [Deltaproteobacteria bacterium]|nr:hydantoinase/oxoprolinase family protein [Deltaproteobacteria bacterium]
MKVGVDIGGTFTDLVALTEDGEVRLGKAPSTPEDLTAGIREALREAKVELSRVDWLLHGSTIAINTVLERRGARTALLTTEGFRDVYEIGRGNRPEAYQLFFKRPAPLVPREWRLEVPERLNSRGEVLRPLDEPAARAALARLRAGGIESVAVCFLHSYANPIHEQVVGALLAESLPGVYVSLSHAILRECREYERTSTTVLNAYVGPVVECYLQRLQAMLAEEQFQGTFLIMQSNGGAMAPGVARRLPVAMMESGPVAGVIGAAELGRALGCANVIALDMGGTTAKASLIEAGAPRIATGYHIGGYAAGQPMLLPVVDIVEVGAGGGSLAWVDAAGGLKVGPVSAGASPGPACYGRGGSEATITDANLVLGRLHPEAFLGGLMPIDPEAAARAITARVGTRFGMTLPEAALGILRIADNHLALAVRAVSVERGRDPRDFALVAMGGAGPLHALAIARELHIPRVIIPPLPGHFSALGMLLAELRHDYVQTFLAPDLLEADVGALNAIFDRMAAEGRAQLEAEGVRKPEVRLGRWLDLRYRGQEATLPIPLDQEQVTPEGRLALRRRFDERHEQQYGHAAPGEPVEVVGLRLQARGSTGPRTFPETLTMGRRMPSAGARPVWFDAARPIECPVHWREALEPGAEVRGPAIIQEAASTTLLHPGDVAEVAAGGALVIKVGG